MRSRLGVGVFFAVVGATSLVRAEPSDQDRALATTLFDEAKALLGDGHVAEACRKLEESERLDPLPGTKLNLAVCLEREGKTASALAEFREARVLAQRDQRLDRVELADQHIKDLEGRLSGLVIAVDPGAATADLTIARDGTVLGNAAWGVRIPVDPGEHTVEASAAGKKPLRVAVTVGADGDTQTVTIGALEDEAPPPPPAPAVVPPPIVPSAADAARVEAPRGLSTRRTVAVAAAGVGVVGVGLGTFFGVRAIVKHDDRDATCTTTPCSSTSVSLNDQAKFAADASTVSFAVGVVGLAAGAILWFGDPSAAPKVSVAPVWTRGGASLGAAGRF
jgi:hypothetical protein